MISVKISEIRIDKSINVIVGLEMGGLHLFSDDFVHKITEFIW